MDTELRQADEVRAIRCCTCSMPAAAIPSTTTVLPAQIGPQPDAAVVTVAAAVIEMIHLATSTTMTWDGRGQVRRVAAPSANAHRQQRRDPGWRLPYWPPHRGCGEVSRRACGSPTPFAQLVTGQMRGVDSIEQ